MQVVGPIAIGRGHIEHTVLLNDIAQVIGRLHDGLPRLLTNIKAQQDACIEAVTYLIDGITDGLLYRRTAVALYTGLVIWLSCIDLLP